VVLVANVINIPLGKYRVFLARTLWKARDKRMDLVNELLQNIRFLKFYGWGNQWSRKACDSREDELQWRVKENVVSVIMSFIWWVVSSDNFFAF